MAFDFDPSRAAEYVIEIPTDSIKSIRYLNEKPLSGGKTVMFIDVIPDFVVKHSGMLSRSEVEKDYIRKSDVERDYVWKNVLLSVLEERAKDHERNMKERGERGLYSAALLHRHQRDLILEMINEIKATGMISRDA